MGLITLRTRPITVGVPRRMVGNRTEMDGVGLCCEVESNGLGLCFMSTESKESELKYHVCMYVWGGFKREY